MRPGSYYVFRFGPFEADVQAGELRKDGVRVPLQGQPFLVLAALIERPGELVWRDDLRHRVWPEDTFVEFDHALNTAVKKIRTALGDCANSPEYVETIPKRGYRFLVPVQVSECSSTRPLEPVSLWRDPWLGRTAILGAVFAIVLLSRAWIATSWEVFPRLPAPRKMVLAILPLEDWSGDGSHGLLCDGITQELKADYLMEGNVRDDGELVRVTVELIRASDKARVWGGDFDRESGDSLALES